MSDNDYGYQYYMECISLGGVFEDGNGSIIPGCVDGNSDLSDSLVFFLDGVYDNRSRLVMHKDSVLLSPKLEVFYSK